MKSLYVHYYLSNIWNMLFHGTLFLIETGMEL